MGRAQAAVTARNDASAELARAAAVHHADFRAVLVEQHDFVWRLLRRLGVYDHAVEDAVQEVFWTYARRWRDVEPGRERSFLFGVALRVAARVRRANARRVETSDTELIESMADGGTNPEQLLEARRARLLLDAVLDRLKPELRVVFVLFELEGLEIAEIAALIGIPKGTVGSRLRRGREQFSTIAQRMRARLRSGGTTPCL
jgi:RNA polymerase sigma-70 factor (ECF subfamily)